jgi:hypothetical protein
MACHVSRQDVGDPLSRLSKRDHGAGLWVGRRPAGGGPISRPPYLCCSAFPLLSCPKRVAVGDNSGGVLGVDKRGGR